VLAASEGDFQRAFTLDEESLGLYRQLGTEAMQENSEWVAIYRQRPIQPLQG